MKILFLPFSDAVIQKKSFIIAEKILSFGLYFLCAVSFLSRFFSELYWLFDIFAHFPLHIAVIAIFLAGFFWKVNKKKKTIASIVLVIFNFSVLFLSITNHYATSCPSFKEPLTVLSANIYYKNNDTKEFREFLKNEKPDIFAVVEMTKELREAIWEVFGREYRYTTYPVEWGIGIGLWSKYTINNFRYSLTRRHKVPYLIADVEVPGQTVSVVILHAWSPGRGDQTKNRDKYLDHIAEVVANIPDNKPVIVMGDFNTTRFVPVFKRLVERAHLNASESILPSATWPSILGFMGVQIDHILTKCLPEPELSTVKIPGADHRAMKAVFNPQK